MRQELTEKADEDVKTSGKRFFRDKGDGGEILTFGEDNRLGKFGDVLSIFTFDDLNWSLEQVSRVVHSRRCLLNGGCVVSAGHNNRNAFST